MATAKTKSTNGAEAPQVEETLDAGFAAAENVAKSNTDAALKGYESFVTMSRDAFDAMCRAGGEVKGFEQVVAVPKANFEAMVEAGNAVARSVETFNGRFFDLARAQIAEGVAAQKALFGAKTFQEAVEIQQGFVRKSIDRAMHDGVELSSSWVKLATEATQPLTQRFQDAAKKAA